MEAESAFDDGEWMFSGESGHGGIVQHEDSYCLSTIDLAVELCFGEVVVELAVLGERQEDVGDVVSSGGGNGGE